MMGTSDGSPGVRRAQHFRSRAPADALFDHEVTGVEVGLRTDPDAIPDPAGTIHAPLNHSLFPEKHAAPDLECLGMAEDDAAADRHAVAHRSCERSQHHAPHHRVELRFALHEAAIQPHQAGDVVARPQMLRQTAFERGVRLDLTSAVHGRHSACPTDPLTCHFQRSGSGRSRVRALVPAGRSSRPPAPDTPPRRRCADRPQDRPATRAAHRRG